MCLQDLGLTWLASVFLSSKNQVHHLNNLNPSSPGNVIKVRTINATRNFIVLMFCFDGGGPFLEERDYKEEIRRFLPLLMAK